MLPSCCPGHRLLRVSILEDREDNLGQLPLPCPCAPGRFQEQMCCTGQGRRKSCLSDPPAVFCVMFDERSRKCSNRLRARARARMWQLVVSYFKDQITPVWQGSTGPSCGTSTPAPSCPPPPDWACTLRSRTRTPRFRWCSETAPGAATSRGKLKVCVCVPGQIILSRQYGSDGRFTFTSHTPGEHQICLHSNSTKMALFAGGKLVGAGSVLS